MPAHPVERRLAAILAADVAGYSRLIGQDEAGTRARFNDQLAEAVRPNIKKNRGRLVKTMGDGFLVEFGSVVDAVQCAAEIQSDVAHRQNAESDDRKLLFRIGVHLGDVIVEEDDIHGDGVNVAARLEGMCEPGAVYVSGSVFEQVTGKLDVKFDDLGEQELKNIARPIRAYRATRLNKSVTPPAPREELSGREERPSIAVLPFDNLSGDPEQAYFADGMAEDLLTDLSKISGLFVASRNASFAFRDQMPSMAKIGAQLGVTHVLEGSVRKMGERLRINVQLVEARNGGHVWAERYDGELSEIFDFQDRIRDEIVTALKLQLNPEIDTVARRHRTTNLQAYDLYLKGRSQYFQYSPDALAKGLAYLEEAIGLDPELAEAYSYIAAFRTTAHLHGSTGGDGNLNSALEAAEKAVELDPNSAVAHTRLGWVQTVRLEFDSAEASFHEAMSLDPELSEVFHYYNYLKFCTGDFEASLKSRDRTLKLNPFEPLQDLHLGIVRYFQDRLDEAIPAIEADRKRTPQHMGVRLFLAAAYAQSGRSDDASREIEAIRSITPDYTVEIAGKVLPFAPEDLDKLLDGLRKAGLPE